MYLSAQYDPHASKLSEKLTFYAEKFELKREDIVELKKKKFLKLIEPESLPEIITCQVLIYHESFQKVKIILFNPAFSLPSECSDEPFLNKDLLDWSEKNGGFWIEFFVPLDHEAIDLDFSFNM